MTFVILVTAVILATATLLPQIRLDKWWIRVFDFPRLQIFLLGLITLAAFFTLLDINAWLHIVILGLLILVLLTQGIRILPYTRFYSKEVINTGDADIDAPSATISVVVANVLMSNRDASRLLQLIEESDPDVILALEPDNWWEQQLSSLEARYPRTVKKPLDNRYGMLLYSRLEILEPRIKHLISDEIPSMHMRVRLDSGQVIWLHCLHPEPPSPTEADESTERDAELLIVGREVEDRDTPTIVTGDLNDVAWSDTTTLFQKTSRLLDPRKGRGMFNTFHAKYPFLRWPLDHVFHSDHFTVVKMQRLGAFGSDHFPVYVHLALQPEAAPLQTELVADDDDRELAQEKIDEVNQQEFL